MVAPRGHAARAGGRGARRALCLALLVPLLAVAARAGDEPPRCEAVASVEPRRAYVGQQVTYRLRILRRGTTGSVRWRESLSFPGFRVEWLPGIVRRPIRDARGEADVFDERRALFPARAGRLVIPAAALLCNGPEGDLVGRIAPIEMEVLPAPAAPDDWTGVVGPVEVRAHVDAQQAHIGQALRVAVLLHGTGSVWNARVDPTRELEAQGAEVFAHPVEMARDAGRALTLRRYLVYDVVPRREGALRVPALQVRWLDPETGGFALARSRERLVRVVARPAPPPDAGDAEAAAPEAAGARVRGTTGAVALLATAAALAAGAAIASWRRLKRARRADPGDSAQALLSRAAAAERAGDLSEAAAALARGVRIALRERVPGALSLSTEELFERATAPDERTLVVLLQRLDRARFGRALDAAEVRDAHASLQRALARGAGVGVGG